MSGPTPPGGPQYGEQPGQQPGYGQQPPAPPPGYPQQPAYPPPPSYAPPPPGYGPPQPGPTPPPSGYPQQQPPGTMGPLTTKFARIDPGPSEGFGVPALVVAAIGAVLTVVAFTALDWFERSAGERQSHFSDVHDVLNLVGSGAAGPAKAYFGWLAWVLLVVTAASALIAAIPTVGRAFRVITPLLALVSIGVTFLAIKLLKSGLSYSEYLKHTRAGFYLALAGFLFLGIAGVMGARRQRS